MDDAHKALLDEIRRRLDAAVDDPKVQNRNGTNYRAPHVTRAIDGREDDGPALVKYIKGALRKSADSEVWNALLDADRLDISFEDMVATAEEPIRSLFTDEDRRLAIESLEAQRSVLARRREDAEAVAVAQDQRIVAKMGELSRRDGKPWSPEREAKALEQMAAKRRPTG